MKKIGNILFFGIVFIAIIGIVLSNDDENSNRNSVQLSPLLEKRINWQLVWSDEFDGSSLDLTKWSYQTGNAYNGWGNYEAQYYTEDNISVQNGMLIITAKSEKKEGFDYTSGRIRTMTDDGVVLFSTLYGRIEAMISMPKGTGLWPAFWMMPVNNEYGSWPTSGEIDIVEGKGRIPDVVDGTIHFGESRPNNKNWNGEYYFENSDISDFHEYAIEWTPDEIRWYVDDELYYRMSNWYTVGTDGELDSYPAPFDKPFYLLLNLAVGGTYDGGRLPEGKINAQMKVDYVRVYENQGGYKKDVQTKRKFYLDNETYEAVKQDNYIKDGGFTTINLRGYSVTPEIEADKWYFVVKDYFGGEGKGKLVEIDDKIYFYCDINKPGEKRYSLQLQHQIPLVKGYTYVVEFEAKAKNNREMTIQALGNQNEKSFSYSGSITFELSEEMEKYYCSFTMKEETNLEAILEFNMGLEKEDITIGNIVVRCLE